MLAQSFKTAEELGLETYERDGLIAVLGMLDRGVLVHDRNRDGIWEYGFNMISWHRCANDCGTVGCIGGWAEAIGKFDFVSMTPPLERLFSPDISGTGCVETDWGSITPAQAANALRSYLTTGRACWREAMS